MNSINRKKLISYQIHLIEKLNFYIASFEDIEKILFEVEKKLISFEKKQKNKNLLIEHFLLKEEEFQKKEQKIDIMKPFYYSVLKSEKVFLEYISFFVEFSLFLKELKLNTINKNTLEELLNNIFSYNQSIKEEMLFVGDFSLNDFLIKKVKVKSFSKIIKKEISYILNLIFNDLFYRKDLDLNKLNKVSFKDLEIGDIILTRKKSSNSKISKTISFLLDSPFVHVSIIYKIEEMSYYTLEVDAYNNKKAEVLQFKFKEDEKYVVLRSRKKLSNKNKKFMRMLQEKYLTRDYSILKVFGAFFRRHKEKFFKNSFLPFKRKANLFRNIEGIFCSEVVAEIYSDVGIELGLLEDSSIVSPLDILNSPQLKIIGYLKNEN